jgi:hypothetical protein
MAIGCLAVALSLNAGVCAKADTVQLLNGDSIRGKVVSLDEKQLVFRSQSFGELKIGRDKIDLIVLGDKPLPSAHAAANPATASATGAGSLLNQVAPLLSTPAAQQQLGPMVDQLLGAGGLGDLQKNVETARRGLTDLKKDFGNGPESQALDAYINLFNILSPPAPAKSSTQPHAQSAQKNPQKDSGPSDKKQR